MKPQHKSRPHPFHARDMSEEVFNHLQQGSAIECPACGAPGYIDHSPFIGKVADWVTFIDTEGSWKCWQCWLK